MADMSKLKKEFPAQQRERLQWQLDTIRENQEAAGEILMFFTLTGDVRAARELLSKMHKQDRDALLQPGGIFTPEQIEILTWKEPDKEEKDDYIRRLNK